SCPTPSLLCTWIGRSIRVGPQPSSHACRAKVTVEILTYVLQSRLPEPTSPYAFYDATCAHRHCVRHEAHCQLRVQAMRDFREHYARRGAFSKVVPGPLRCIPTYPDDLPVTCPQLAIQSHPALSVEL